MKTLIITIGICALCAYAYAYALDGLQAKQDCIADGLTTECQYIK